MKKGNIIDLIMYRNQLECPAGEGKSGISEELQEAIESLINRLKEATPLKQGHCTESN